MSESRQAEFSQLLYLALAEPIGLLCQTSDVKRARAQLYAARQAVSDPALDCIQLRVSPFQDGNLVICKGGPLAKPASKEEELL